MTALILRWREVPPVLWRWRGPAAMATALSRRSPGSIATVVGPPGASARVCIGFGWVGLFAAGEDIGGAVVSGATLLSAADCKARVDIAPVANAAFAISRNGAAIGEVLIGAGELTGAVVLSDSALADGDLMKFTAPAVADAALSGLYVTLASAA